MTHATYSASTLTVEERDLILRTLDWAKTEIHNPGACRHSNIDILERIEAAQRSLALLNACRVDGER